MGFAPTETPHQGQAPFLVLGPGSAHRYGPFQLFRPQVFDRIFGAMFVVDERRTGASSGSGSLAGIFNAFGPFGPQFGGPALEAAAGASSDETAGKGIFGRTGVRLPWVDGGAELALNLLLAGLLLLSLLLFGLSAIPARVVVRTPFSVEWFRDARPYFACAATSVLLGAALIYGMGRLTL